MAMPASGIIRLSGCSQACGSISVAACGNATMPRCLSALSTAAGKSAPHAMSEFYSYDNTLIITPADPIANIAAAGTTCNLTVCGPAFNIYTFADACSWITPNAPEIPSPTGSAVGIVIAANTGAARAGLLCITPTVGSRQDRCFCQLVGATTTTTTTTTTTAASKGVKFITISCLESNYWSNCISGCTMSTGECYTATIPWSLCSVVSGIKSSAAVRLYCNGTQLCICCITAAVSCAGTWCPLIKYGERWVACTTARAFINTGSDYCSQMNMCAITNCVGSFSLSTPCSMFTYSADFLP